MGKKWLLVFGLVVLVVIGIGLVIFVWYKSTLVRQEDAVKTNFQVITTEYIDISGKNLPLGYKSISNDKRIVSVVGQIKRVYGENGDMYADLLFADFSGRVFDQKVLLVDKNNSVDFIVYKQKSPDFFPTSENITKQIIGVDELQVQLGKYLDRYVTAVFYVQSLKDGSFDEYLECNSKLLGTLDVGAETGNNIGCIGFTNQIFVYDKN